MTPPPELEATDEARRSEMDPLTMLLISAATIAVLDLAGLRHNGPRTRTSRRHR